MPRKIVVVGHSRACANIVQLFGEVSFISHGEKLPEDAELVVFTGGSDVSPNLYNEEEHDNTWCDKVRDSWEVLVFMAAKQKGIPMVGICRGAQFLTVMNGGKLIQDVTNHGIAGSHEVYVVDRLLQEKTNKANLAALSNIKITSTHHQMMYPWNVSETMANEFFWVLGYTLGLSDKYDGVPSCEKELGIYSDINKSIEPEIIFWRKTKCLCVQGHPEIMPPTSGAYLLFQNFVGRYLLA